MEVATAAVETGGMVRCCSPGTGWGMMGFSDTDRLDSAALHAHELSLAAGSRVPVALAASLQEFAAAGGQATS